MITVQDQFTLQFKRHLNTTTQYSLSIVYSINVHTIPDRHLYNLAYIGTGGHRKRSSAGKELPRRPLGPYCDK